jgi:hypothetical protein
MRVYLDTGVFIDYFINRSHVGHYLRTGSRRGRTPKKLNKDVISCLSRISRKHEGFTSNLTLYELEHALFTAMKNTYKGSSHLDRYLDSGRKIGSLSRDYSCSIIQDQVGRCVGEYYFKASSRG